MALFIAALIFFFLLAPLAWYVSKNLTKRAAAVDAAVPPAKTRTSRYEDYTTTPDAGTLRLWASISKYTAITLAVGAAIMVFAASANVVSTKNVGIVTEFGKPVGSVGNGFTFQAPWANITEMDAAIQTDKYSKTSNDCITVRIAYQATACVDVSIRWRITEKSAPQLFQNYRTFDHVRDSLVTRELNAAMNVVFQNYDPLAVNPDGTSATPSLATLDKQVSDLLATDIGSQIELQSPSVIISVLNFTQPVQDRIDALYQQIGDTRVAQQQLLTNQAQAKANQALASSLSNDPMVLVSKCLDLIAKGFQPPAGFSCWPGQGSSVVVPATK